MSCLDTASLVFIPNYQFFSVRDYDMYERPGATEALIAAHKTIVAAGDCEVFVVCAQDLLKVGLTVSLYDAPVGVDPTGWDSTRRFTLPFPTGVLHAGDGFGNVINLELPHTGSYAVILQYSGRDEAAATLLREWPVAAALPLDQTREVLDRWAGLERYQITVFPA